MTKTEYESFQRAVAHTIDSLDLVSTGACPGCSECELSEDPTGELQHSQ